MQHMQRLSFNALIEYASILPPSSSSSSQELTHKWIAPTTFLSQTKEIDRRIQNQVFRRPRHAPRACQNASSQVILLRPCLVQVWRRMTQVVTHFQAIYIVVTVNSVLGLTNPCLHCPMLALREITCHHEGREQVKAVKQTGLSHRGLVLNGSSQ